MKRFIHLSAVILLFGIFSFDSLIAQAPEAFSYQAQARNSQGQVLRNKKLKVKIIIRADQAKGERVWVGLHTVMTDNFGMFDLFIGKGKSNNYRFSSIEWGKHAHFLNVKVLYKNQWSDMGTTQFMSVPYALSAAKVEQNAFDAIGVTESLTVGGGLEITKIHEITGTTHATNNKIRFPLPAGMNTINTRVLDLAIYKYGIIGEGGYHGQGWEDGGSVVGYTLWHSDQFQQYYLIIHYPDYLKGQPFRATLMQVEGSVVIGM